MLENNFYELEKDEVEQLNGGSVASGALLLGTTITTCAEILGGGSSLLLGVGLVTACAPAAVVVGVAGAAISGAMIGKGIAKKKLV